MMAERSRGDAEAFAAMPRGDVTALPDLLHGQPRAGPIRDRRPVYVDLIPPCNSRCPAGENIQAWLAHARAGRHEPAWRPLPRGRVRASLAADTGVEHASDVTKYLLAGSDIVQSASALLRHDPESAGVLLQELCNWMNRKGYQALAEARGLLAAPDAGRWAAQERADYV
jgi:hypothetical protein